MFYHVKLNSYKLLKVPFFTLRRKIIQFVFHKVLDLEIRVEIKKITVQNGGQHKF